MNIDINTLPGLEDVPAGTLVSARASPGPHTPFRNPDFVFRKEIIGELMAAEMGMINAPIYVFGPSQASKTSTIEQWHAYRNLELITVTIHPDMDFGELVSRPSIMNGTEIILPGPLYTAAKEGIPFLANELDRANPSLLVGLNDFLQGRPIYACGEFIVAAKGFRFYSTGNTAFSGDDTGNFGTAKVMDISTIKRFRKIEVDYPTTDVEINALNRFVKRKAEQMAERNEVFELADAAVAGLARFAFVTRQAYKATLGLPCDAAYQATALAGGASQPVSTFELMMAIDSLPGFLGRPDALVDACMQAFLRALPPATREGYITTLKGLVGGA